MATPTPTELGYRMPPEWALHQATWISWPHKEASWPGKFEPVPGVMAQSVKALASSEHVRINVVDEVMAADVNARLQAAGVPQNGYTLHRFPTNDAWCRDHGAIFVTRHQGSTQELAATK